MDALGDGSGDRDGGSGIALEGEEGFPHGDLDLLLAPRDDLVVTTDDAQGGLHGGVAVDGDFARAIQEETLGDEVGVVIDEGFLDELVEGVEREAERILIAREFGEIGGDLAADADEPEAVGIGEDLFFALREGDVGQGLAEGVGHFGEHETLLAVRAEEDDGGKRNVFPRDRITPGVVGFLLNGGVDGAFEGEIVREGGIAHGGKERGGNGEETEMGWREGEIKPVRCRQRHALDRGNRGKFSDLANEAKKNERSSLGVKARRRQRQ